MNFLRYSLVLAIGEAISASVAWRLGTSHAAQVAAAALLLGPVFTAAAIEGGRFARAQRAAPDFGAVFDFTHIATAIALVQMLVAFAIAYSLDPERLLSLSGRRALEMGGRALFLAVGAFALSFTGLRFGAKLHLRRAAARRRER